MKTHEVSNTMTISGTEVYYEAKIEIEEETYEMPGSQDITIKSLQFEGDFNPYEIEATREFMIKPGQNLAQIVEKNIDSFTIGGRNIRNDIEENAVNEI